MVPKTLSSVLVSSLIVFLPVCMSRSAILSTLTEHAIMNRSECYIHPQLKETVKLTSNHDRNKQTGLTTSIIRLAACVVVSVLRSSCVRRWLSRSKVVIYQGIRVIAETVLCSFFSHQVLMPNASGLRQNSSFKVYESMHHDTLRYDMFLMDFQLLRLMYSIHESLCISMNPLMLWFLRIFGIA